MPKSPLRRRRPAAALSIGSSQAGNYLSALVASADRDNGAAELYFREALRADPRNLELLEHAFASALASGDAQGAFPLADRLIARDPGNSLARLALASRAIVDGQWPVARAQLTAGDAGKAHDVTTSLLIAWTWAGAGDLKRALDVADHIADPSLRVFRDYHAGLIADVLGNPVEARRRLKLAYDADKNTLRLATPTPASCRATTTSTAPRRSTSEFGKLIPNHPVVVAALADLERRQAARAVGRDGARRRGGDALRARRRQFHAAGRRTRRAHLSASRAARSGPITISRRSPSPICSPT